MLISVRTAQAQWWQVIPVTTMERVGTVDIVTAAWPGSDPGLALRYREPEVRR